MTRPPRERLLRWAGKGALVSLALIVWPTFDHSPLAVIAAMSLGQLLGTVCLVVFGSVVLRDLRKAGLLPRKGLFLKQLREKPGRDS